MILNVEIRKKGEQGYAVLEQAASDHTAKDAPIFEGSREAVGNWLASRGVPQTDVERAFAEAKADSGALLEANLDYSEAEDFPRL